MHKVLRNAIYAIFSLFALYAKAQQPFQKTYFSDTSYVNYAADEIQAIVPVYNGFMLAGSTQGYANVGEAGLLMQVDSLGNVVASHSYRKGYVTNFKSMAKATDGNLIVTGATSNCDLENCPTRMLIAKLDTNGQQVWELDVLGGSNDIGYSIKPTIEGNFIVGGWYNNIVDNRGYDMLVLKITGNGDTLWTRVIGTNGHEFTYDAVETASGSVIVTANQNGNILLMKLDANGNLQWVKDYGRGAARKVISTNNGYVVAGYKSAAGAFEITDPFILKVDTNGTPIFYKTFYGADYDYLSDIKQLSDSSFIICGMTLSFAYDVTDLYLIKCNSDGTISWARAYGGYEYDEGTTVLPLADNTFLAAGTTASFNHSNGTRYSAWLVKTDTLGATLNCRDHAAFPILIEHTTNPVDVPVFITKKITLTHSNLVVDEYNMNRENVCPDINGVGEQAAEMLNIYPNPANDIVFIQTLKPTTIKLFNATGQLVLTSNQPQLNCSHLSNGLYVVQVQQGAGISSKRMVIQH